MPPRISTPDKTCLECGQSFNRSTSSSGRLEGMDDYHSRRFCSADCYHLWMRGPNHYAYSESGSSREDGYVRVSRNGKRVYLHRWTMEQHLGRPLRTDEHVHHRDGDPENNALINLQLTTNREHLRMHYHERTINTKGQFV